MAGSSSDQETAELLRFLLCREDCELLGIAYGDTPEDHAPNAPRQAYFREKLALMHTHSGFGRITWWLALDAGGRARVRQAALEAAGMASPEES